MINYIKVALLGNPNTGKTSVFNALTGLNQKVGITLVLLSKKNKVVADWIGSLKPEYLICLEPTV